MSTKQKSDVKVLKGQEAEDKVLEYVKMMNRPYGAVDVSANLKGAVPKTATQKILVVLAEKGELVQKTYGKGFKSSLRVPAGHNVDPQGKPLFLLLINPRLKHFRLNN
ncbi:hypothetical protein E1B28_010036 [Marasmius oreades]|uniref:Homologous-pairing protein 2 winged helix domain-containing protein n=1 Tax=Marasmius oreades TaxID=181124 RepID=A0A9P7RWA4_9AGAR|nr:uncharacterized protein E1B28_010036 [Marasmius oreades]KAG7090969.1 hypothetical protein E1B28_010036 [Marasmius oreades]